MLRAQIGAGSFEDPHGWDPTIRGTVGQIAKTPTIVCSLVERARGASVATTRPARQYPAVTAHAPRRPGMPGPPAIPWGPSAIPRCREKMRDRLVFRHRPLQLGPGASWQVLPATSRGGV